MNELLLSLKGKVAVVTGSTRGLGFAISKEFAENNDATVIACSRSKQSAVKSAEKIKGKTFAAEIGGVTNSSSIERFLQQILSDHKRIDILKGSVRYQGQLYILCCRMISKRGVIINISSIPAIAGYTKGAPYTIAKAANIALTKCIAMEYGSKNIRAYTLALGNIATLETYYSMNKNDRNKAAEEPSMKRGGRPEEVAKVVACIASCNFSFVTGITIVIDGGTVLL
jgi:3-oxoacyl-[acyl-carrier protein] reductase